MFRKHITIVKTLFPQLSGAETLHLVDSGTGEAVIIVADKSIVDVVREHHAAMLATDGGCSLARIEQILMKAREGLVTSSSSGPEQTSALDPVAVKQEQPGGELGAPEVKTIEEQIKEEILNMPH